MTVSTESTYARTCVFFFIFAWCREDVRSFNMHFLFTWNTGTHTRSHRHSVACLPRAV